MVSGDVYEVTALDVNYNYSWAASTLNLSGSYENQDYVTSGEIDRDLVGAVARWTTNYGGGWSSRFTGDFAWADYDDGLSDKTYLLYAGVNYASTPNISYALGVNWERRFSDAPDDDYEDWGVVFRVRYDR